MNRSARPHSNSPSPYQDETFAYIAGYTEGGFAYGVTWEEWEQFEQETSKYSELEGRQKNRGLERPGRALKLLSSNRGADRTRTYASEDRIVFI